MFRTVIHTLAIVAVAYGIAAASPAMADSSPRLHAPHVSASVVSATKHTVNKGVHATRKGAKAVGRTFNKVTDKVGGTYMRFAMKTHDTVEPYWMEAGKRVDKGINKTGKAASHTAVKVAKSVKKTFKKIF